MKKVNLTIMLMLLLILSSCTNNDPSDNTFQTPEDRGLDSKELGASGYFALYQQIAYGYNFTTDSRCKFYKYDLSAETIEVIDYSDVMNMATNRCSMLDGELYFYFGNPIDEEDNKFVNTLYKLDTKDNSVSKIYDVITCTPLIYTRPKSENEFYALMLYLSDDIVTSQLIEYNRSQESVSSVYEKKFDYEKMRGEQIISFDYDANTEKLYILITENNDGAYERKIEVMNNNGVIENSMDVTQVFENIAHQVISKFYVANSYIYLQNFSNDAMIAIMTDDGIKPFITGDYEFRLNRASDCLVTNERYQYFYRGDIAQIIILDMVESTLRFIDMSGGDSSARIRYILSDKDEILISMIDNDKFESITLYTVRDLLANNDDVRKIDVNNVIVLNEQEN
ncbi:MAG: hypothetical protein FWG31_05945 [Oscillospiraceae bacterium]|nr:hypothetical protein [Oscillospiraceae bacterium]